MPRWRSGNGCARVCSRWVAMTAEFSVLVLRRARQAQGAPGLMHGGVDAQADQHAVGRRASRRGHLRFARGAQLSASAEASRVQHRAASPLFHHFAFVGQGSGECLHGFGFAMQDLDQGQAHGFSTRGALCRSLSARCWVPAADRLLAPFSSRSVASRPSAILLGSILIRPSTMAWRISSTRAVSMSLSLSWLRLAPIWRTWALRGWSAPRLPWRGSGAVVRAVPSAGRRSWTKWTD